MASCLGFEFLVIQIQLWEDTHMMSMKIFLFSRQSTPCPSLSEFFPRSWPLASNFIRTPPSPRTITALCIVHVNEQNQNKNQVMPHSKWPRVLFFHLAHKQCNGIIKEWLHCLTLEPLGMLSGPDVNPSFFNKKIKILDFQNTSYPPPPPPNTRYPLHPYIR